MEGVGGQGVTLRTAERKGTERGGSDWIGGPGGLGVFLKIRFYHV